MLANVEELIGTQFSSDPEIHQKAQLHLQKSDIEAAWKELSE